MLVGVSECGEGEIIYVGIRFFFVVIVVIRKFVGII